MDEFDASGTEFFVPDPSWNLQGDADEKEE